MATINVTVNGSNSPSPFTVPVRSGNNTIIWTPRAGLSITEVRIGGDWPAAYGQPTRQGNTWRITYDNTAIGTYPYTVTTDDAAMGASGSVPPEYDETPEIQNQGGGGGYEPEAEA